MQIKLLSAVEIKKVFIVSSGRSGSHWLLDLLLNHPDCIGERQTESKIFRIIEPYLRPELEKSRLRKLKDLIKYMGTIKGDKIWNSIIHQYDSYPENSSLKRFIERNRLINLINQERYNNTLISDQLISVAREILEQYIKDNKEDNTKALVEKTPGHVSAVDLILDNVENAKIIELVRDGRDVCKSFESLSTEGFVWASKSRKKQIRLWKHAINLGAHWRSNNKFKPRILLVKYESLVANPQNELKRIFKFIDLDYADETIEKIVEKSEKINSYGSKSKQHWRNVFGANDIKLIHRLAKNELKMHGYI